jgi:6-phospho-3-hexuloisomerase
MAPHKKDCSMELLKLTQDIVDENLGLLAKVQKKQIAHFIQGIQEAGRVFCGAQGRSGYILRCFCMRLMHLGYQSYFAGETVTPRIGKGDIVVVLSGSGHTGCTCQLAKMGRQHGAATYGIIGVEDSPLGRALEHVVYLPGGARPAELDDGFRSIQPPGSLFEQTAFMLLEAVVLHLYQRQGSDRQALLNRHTNFE